MPPYRPLLSVRCLPLLLLLFGTIVGLHAQPYTYKAYDTAHTRKGVRLARMRCRVLKQARRNKPLTRQQKRTNTTRSRVRARIEHVFGAIDKQMGGLQVRSIGLACATFHVGLTNLCYNMLRTLTLLTSKPFVGNV